MSSSLNNITSLTQLSNIASRRVNGKEVLSVPVDDLISTAQVRRRFRNLEELGAALKKDGQDHPILTFPKDKDGKYLIRKGERRWRAAKLIGLARVDVIVDSRMLERIDEITGQLGENIHRDSLTAFEIADALGELQSLGLSNVEIAEKVGKGKAFVTVHLKLLGLPNQIRALAKEELTDDAETLYNLGRINELSPERCAEILAIAREEKGVSRDTTRKILADLKGESDMGKRGPKVQESKQKVVESDVKEGAQKAAKAPGDVPPASSINATPTNPENSPQNTLDAVQLAKAATQNSPAAQPVKPADTTVATKPNDAHKQPSAVTVQTNPDLNYLPVQAEKLCIAIQLKSEDGDSSYVTDGFLMTDRVSLRKGYVWMQTRGGNVTEVLVEQITLVGVNTNE